MTDLSLSLSETNLSHLKVWTLGKDFNNLAVQCSHHSFGVYVGLQRGID